MSRLSWSNTVFILLTTYVGIVSGQVGSIKVKYIGNCGLHLSDGKTNLYVDFPYKSGAYNYLTFKKEELDSIPANSVFLFTHKHADHHSRNNLRKVKKTPRANVIVNGNKKKVEMLNSSLDEFQLEAFRTKHRFTFKHYSYLLTWHGNRLYFSGDTESADTLAKMKNMDYAFAPYWVMLDAKERQLEVDARKVGIYHLYPNQTLKIARPEKIFLFDQQGMTLEIPFK